MRNHFLNFWKGIAITFFAFSFFNLNAQVFNYSKPVGGNILDITIEASNPCDNPAVNVGSITFTVNAATGGSALLIFLDGPGGTVVGQPIGLGAGNAFVFTPADPSAGPYNFIIRNANNTVTINTFVELAYPAITLSNYGPINLTDEGSNTNTSCISPDGVIQSTVTGGSGNFSYVLDLGGTPVATGTPVAGVINVGGLTGGNYTLTVNDDYSVCFATIPITVVNTSPTITVNSTTSNSRCASPFNGAVAITVSGSAGPFTFAWTGPNGFTSSSEDLTAVEDGNYSVLVTDTNNGCTATANVTVNDITPTLVLSNITTANSRCLAPFNGAIDLSVAGSAGPFTYAWTGPGGPFTTQDLTAVQNGAYSVTVTDVPSGCIATANINVANTAPSLILTNTVTNNSRCVAPFNGAIDLTVAGSAGPFIYAWTGPGGPFTTQDLTAVQNGAYSVTVTDVPSGCTGTANINVGNTAPSLSLSSTVTANSRCVAPFNGAIDLTVTGSAGPFTYAWTGPGGPFTTQDLTAVQNGSYSVTVTDTPSGCTATANINVNNTSPTLNLTSTVTNNSRCVAPFNGAIDLTVAGSAGPFTYAWTGPGGPFTTQDLTAVQNGSYSVTVTDTPSGCTATANINVNNTAPTLSLTSTVTNNSRCVAPFNGAIDLTVSGSAGPFTYAWTGPGGPFTTQDLTAVQNGSYTVVVTDTPSGCTATTNININNTAPTLNLSSTVTNNSRCVAPFNGAIDLTVTGSAGPFTYAWTGPSGPFTTQDLTALQNGSYTVIVTDTPSGCTATTNINVNNAAPTLNLTNTVTNNSRCVAPFNGAIDLTVAGSAGPFTYVWVGPGGPYSTQDLTGLQTGAYTVTVTDTPSGCTAIANVNVGNATPTLVLSNTVTNNSRCVAPFNGAIDLTVAGSAGPFTYAWTGPGGPFTTQDLTAVQNGNYTVIVTDTPTGCTATANITINNTAPTLVLSNTVTNNSRCAAPFNGAIDLTVSGSAGPFTYAWTGPGGPFTTQDLTAIQNGSYAVTVTDTPSGCTATANINVNNTAPTLVLSSTVTDNTRCAAPFDGAIDLTVSGSAGPFTYAWTGPGGPFTTQDLTDVQNGSYTVIVTDTPSGCTATTNISVGNAASSLTLNGTVTHNTNCTPFNGAIDLTVSGSAGPFTFGWTGPSGFTATSEDITALEPGDYDVIVTETASGCTANTTFTVNDNAPVLSITTTSVTHNTNCVAFNGAIDISVGGSAGPFTIGWTGPNGFTATTEDIASLEPGAYDVLVTDIASGCTASATININDNSPVLSLSNTVTDNTRCATPFNGAIDITVTGSTGPFTFAWTGPNSFSAATEDVTGLEPGDYDILVTDNASGCTVQQTITVNDNTPSLSITSTVTDNTRCVATFNGAIDITVSGAAGPFSYAWTGSGGFTNSGEDITSLEPGDYNVDVTDITSGCVTSALITVDDISVLPSISATAIDNDRCNAPFNGAILLGVTPAGIYTYSWTGPNGFTSAAEDIINLESGLYQVLVTNTLTGCSAVEDVTVNDASPAITVTADAIGDNSSCTAPFNGFILITPSPAGTYTFSWTGPGGFTSSSEDISALREGDYTVTATNTTLGCSEVQTFTVGDNTVTINITSQTITDNTSCSAPFNGAISITAGGTVGPYSFSWTGPGGFTGTGASISALQSGDYDVTITDLTLGCSDVYTLTVGDATPPITVTLDATTDNTSCAAPFTGSLSITASGTAGPYSFDWTGPNGFTSASEDITALENGDYDVTVTDTGLGCVTTATFTVGDSRPVVTIATVSVTDNSSCVAPFNGALTVAGGGTAGPFTYSWTGPSGFTGTGDTNTALEGGDYNITATDQVLGCETTVTITVPSTAPAITATPVITGNSNCLIPFNGAIDITPGGTAGPFSYAWTGPGGFTSASEDIAALQAGDYDLDVTDTNLGCTGSFTFTVPQNATNVTISLASSTSNSNCTAPFNGALDVTIGGTPGPYTIAWTGPGSFSASTEDISNLAAGNYTITVTDDLLGCTANQTFNVGNTATGCGGLNCFAFTVTAVETRPSCALQDDGSVTFTVSGGTPNYIVTLTDSAGFNVSLPGPGPDFAFNNLSPADYFYIIQDQAGNICPLPYSLPIQTNVNADATGFVDVACFGDSTGQATISVLSGGASPYVYSMDNGANWIPFTSPFVITNLPPNGTYSILVADDPADQCPDEVIVTINNINPRTKGTFTVQDATCNVNDGVIDITSTTGGTGGPYSYRLDGGSVTTTLPFTNLSGGNHVITMIDNSGCERDTTIVVSFPGFVNYSAPATIFDATCTTKGTIAIFIPNPPGAYEIGYTFDPVNEPVNYNAGFYNPATGLVTITNLDAGSYYIWIRTSGAACATRFENAPGVREVVVGGPQPLSFEIGCRYSDDDGDGLAVLSLHNISASTSDPVYYEIFGNGFQKSGEITPNAMAEDTIHGFAVGDYVIWLRQDQTTFGCTMYSDTLSAPTGPLDTLSVSTTVSFPDQPTGSMYVKISESGFEPYNIWLVENSFLSDTLAAVRNPVNFEVNFSSLPSGTYTLYLEDSEGCRREYEVVLPFDGSIFVPNVFTPNNDGLNENFFVRNLPSSGSKLSITNRWGKEVFASSNYYYVDENDNSLWDGGGTPDGVYYYRLEVKGGGTYTGWVEIIRGTKP